jgi:hypothetical protein
MMYSTPQRIRNISLFALVLIFALFFAWINLGKRFISVPIPLLAVPAIAFIVLGLVVVALTLKIKETGKGKLFFLLAGASAAAIPICALLHNVVYGLFIWWFGDDFWGRHGTDEPVFFILAVVVLPALFLIGSVGSVVSLVRLPRHSH